MKSSLRFFDPRELAALLRWLGTLAQDCGCSGPPFRWHEARRFLLRCELDAIFFHLYGLDRDDAAFRSLHVERVTNRPDLPRRRPSRQIGRSAGNTALHLRVVSFLSRLHTSGIGFSDLFHSGCDPGWWF